MNRSIIYTQEQPRTFDILWGWRDALIAAGFAQQDMAGSTITTVSGFAALATAPASLNVLLASGRIYAQASVDSTQYGSLPSDPAFVQQQGMAAAQTIALTTAGLSAGQSQWALVEVAFGQTDVIRTDDPTGGVLYYWNSANPTVPFQGPNGTGATQPTERQGVATVQVVYGAPAASGSEVPPTPNVGYVPLYLVDLSFGQSQVTQGQILTSGPSIGANVPNNYPYAPLVAGLLQSHHLGTPGQAPKILMAELAAASSHATGAGLSSVYSYAGNPNGHVAGVAATTGLTPPDLCFDITSNILYFCTSTGNAAAAVWSTASGQATSFVGGTSTGTANAQIVNPVTPSGFALVAGYSVTFTPGINNSGATTLAIGGTAATACRKNSTGTLVAFTGGEFLSSQPVSMVYNGTFWVLQTGTLGALAFLNIGQWLKNDGVSNLTLNVDSTTLIDNGSGALTVSPSSGIATTGATQWRPTAEVLAGWVKGNATTIGNATSSATQRANADTLALYTWIWTNFSNTQCPVVGGRGVSASADFTASKAITTPDMRGLAGAGMDTMGGAATTWWTGVPVTNGNATTAGSILGENLHALIGGELPITTPTFAGASLTVTSNVSDVLRASGLQVQGGSSTPPAGAIGNLGSISSTGMPAGTISSFGNNQPHNTAMRVMLGTWYFKL